ncbi:MAG: triose-phosphate isomerase [Thermoplasmata archaeon]|nr:triose-phosphate isomerase [Thermoplasmata archaeon]
MPRSPTDLAPLGAPVLVLNLKVYANCLGAGALAVGKLLADRARARRVAAALCPAAPDLGQLATSLRIPVLAQHVDSVDPGARTGTIIPESLLASGVVGSLLNHSEHPLPDDEVGRAVARLQALGLVPLVCAKDIDDARRLARFHPAYLAVEPPELIGGDRSVSTARPEVVHGTVEAVHAIAPGTRVLCGAGVHDRNDVRIALELGAQGVLVASAVTKAADPREAIDELLAGFPAGHPGTRRPGR